jgi:hypothetical protein
MPQYNGILPNVPSSNQYQVSYTFSYGSDINQDLSNFTTAKTGLDTKFTIFSSTNNVPVQLQSNLVNYIKSGGVNTQAAQDSNNPLYLNVYNSWTDANVMIKSYQNLTSAMTSALASYNGLSTSESTSIRTISELESKITRLKKELKDSQQDLDISKSRQESVQNAPNNQSYIQGISGKIGFTRPLKPTSVALLMGLGFFIFFVSCLILKDYFTTSADIAAQFFSLNEIMEHLSSNTSRSVMIGVIATFILYAASLYVYFYVYNK